MRRGGTLRHPDRSAPRLGSRFAVGPGHLCQIKFWLMQVNAPKAASPSLATPWASIRGEIIETGLADRLRVPRLLPGGLSAIAHASSAGHAGATANDRCQGARRRAGHGRDWINARYRAADPCSTC